MSFVVMLINDVERPIIVEHKNHAQLSSARIILPVFLKRNSDVCTHIRIGEHGV